jgi:diguanylate cyclase (GGDEF)-like protein/PAS domain S-box-containing protein
MLTNSVQNRFIAIILAALVVLVMPLFLLFFYVSGERASRETVEHAQIVLAANAQALGKPLWDFDNESVKQLAATIASDPAIIAVKVTEAANNASTSFTSTPNALQADTISLSAPIDYHSPDGIRRVGSLTVSIAKPGFLSDNQSEELSLIGIFVIAVLIITAAAILGSRIMILRPLEKLTKAIRATRVPGARHTVEFSSSDEMGELAANFNEMQARLAKEEQELKQAHDRATTTYNLTPAKLYTVDVYDRLIAVSDYWLLATGYRREDVIGRTFSSFLQPESLPAYTEYKLKAAQWQGDYNPTVKFCCADGRVMDVLIKEVPMQEDNGGRVVNLAVMTDVTELKDAEQRNRLQAITDHLTGLLNRQGFENELDKVLAEVNENGGELACLLIDLDRFKAINDNLGHAYGDKVLRTISNRIRDQLRAQDRIARLGGDEFAVLVPARDAEKAATAIAERIVDACEAPILADGHELSVSASVGIALYPAQASSAGELLQRSDMAMYVRKHNGKNGAELFNLDMVKAAREKADISAWIDQGLREDWFEAHMQPVMKLPAQTLAGFECLLRLNHPEHGLIPPGRIIAVAEENGSIRRVGDRMFEKAISQMAELSAIPALSQTRFAVNVSPLQFTPELPPRLAHLMMKAGLAPHRLILEITEAVLMHANPDIGKVLAAIHECGFKIAMDDFGTGYSSLSYLLRYPFNIVKIDQSFISSLTSMDPEIAKRSRKLIEGIRAISQQMNCQVVAEGVETREQAEALLSLDIEFGQGYHFGRPQPVADIIRQYAPANMQQTAGGLPTRLIGDPT